MSYVYKSSKPREFRESELRWMDERIIKTNRTVSAVCFSYTGYLPETFETSGRKEKEIK